MATVECEKQQTIRAIPRITRKMPFLPRLILENCVLHRELGRIKRRLSELEDKISEEKVIILKNVTREEAEEEIRQLFHTGRTLYYSDIVKELGLDLEMVVDICNKLQERGEIGIDARVS